MSSNDEIIVQPIHSSIDLHTFRPKDIPSLIPEYLYECLSRDINRVRIIHGKGSGFLRDSVHKILKRLAVVSDFKNAPPEEGGWGATIVSLNLDN